MTVLQTLTEDTQGEQNFSFNVSFAPKISTLIVIKTQK